VSASNGQYALATELRSFYIDVSSGRAAAEVGSVPGLINVISARWWPPRLQRSRPRTTDIPGAMTVAVC